MKLTTLSKQILTSFLAVGSFFLASCAATPLPPTETPTPAFTETASPTIIWFPATNTPTPLVGQVITPTPDSRPGVGNLLFSDSFDQPDLWNTAASSEASATVTGNRLVLSLHGQGPLSILSLRSQPAVGDFYAEATAEVSLCRQGDLYGLVFRAAGEEFYRFAVNCNGQIRLERRSSGATWPLSDWRSSGDAPSGAPAQVKLGVWATANEIRFYLNDQYQFTVRDSTLPNGTLGFFAYANGTTPVSVAFSDLNVYSVYYISPTPSLTPTGTPIP